MNISLDPLTQRIIVTNQTRQSQSRLTPQQSADLHVIQNQSPLQLVIQRHHRLALQRTLATLPVDASLHQAAASAIVEYQTASAPLRPLSPLQRIAYLDEHTAIRCTLDLSLPHASFHAGTTYAICPVTLQIRTTAKKTNHKGSVDNVLQHSADIAFVISSASRDILFLDEPWCAAHCQIQFHQHPYAPASFHHPLTFQQLIAHFEIPDVPDLAALNPDQYQHNLDLLTRLEQLTSAPRF